MSVAKKITAFGNPLLDTIINIEDNRLLEKYNIKEDEQKQISKEEMMHLTNDISGVEQHKSPGGCSQNMLRVLQWMMRKKCEAYLFGSVGKDVEAENLQNMLEASGVHTRYIQQDLPTGRTVSLVKGLKRTMLAYVGAAEVLPLSDLLHQKEFEPLVMSSDYVYVEGFFLTNRTEAAKYILDICKKNNKLVIFNICGSYIFKVVPEAILQFVEDADIVFGNKHEYETMQQFLKIDCFSNFVQKMIKRSDTKLVIMTDGKNAVKCYKAKTIVEVLPIKMSASDIKDTTGAGDAFAGGFIAGMCLGKDIAECAKMGCYAASNVIAQFGCSLPNTEPDFHL